MRLCSRTSMAVAVTIAMILLTATVIGQTVSTVYNFSGSDGEFPQGQLLAQGRDGLLYGTTWRGGANDYGTIFKLNPRTGILTTLYSFGTQGVSPVGGLTLGSDGNFYGTAPFGGSYNRGVLFRFSPGGVYTVLHEFTGAEDGDYPYSAPIQTQDGIMYGASGAPAESGAIAALYKFAISSGSFSTVYTLPSIAGNVQQPPVQIGNGDLYVSTTYIGPGNCGSILRITPAGVLKSTYTFNSCGAKQGAYPNWMVAAADGNVYGTTSQGGIYRVGGGTIFKDDPRTGIVTAVHDFGAVPNEGEQGAGITLATDGNFYGPTESGGAFGTGGTLYQLTPSRIYTTLYNFQPTSENPFPGPLVQYTTGTLYGLTFFGGINTKGSIYSLDMGLGPFVALVYSQGRVGQTIQILGQGLSGATGVTVNGVATSSFKVVSDTFMTAVIPAGATTGLVAVITPTAVLNSNRNLQVVQ